MKFAIGTRVKHCGETIYRAHDYYLSCGRSGPVRTGARLDYEKKLAARGTVIAPDPRYCSPHGVSVKWDDGTISHCAPIRIQLATA